MSRPEHQAPPELYYDDKEATKYSRNTRVIDIQRIMAERCLELLNFGDESSHLILDIGCGSGLSGEVLAEAGHPWIGIDISQSMLDLAVDRGCIEESYGDVLRHDMGNGFGFRSGIFDGAISVSALQWLCYNDRKDHVSARRLEAFFTSLYKSLRRGARAVLQFYPENEQQLELVSAVAQRCGFTGGLVVDFPNSTKAKKYYLCLFAGNNDASNNTTNINSKHTHIPSTLHGLSSISNGSRGPARLDDTTISSSSSNRYSSNKAHSSKHSSNTISMDNDEEDEETNGYTRNSSSGGFQFGRNHYHLRTGISTSLSSSSSSANPATIPMEMRRAKHKISKSKHLRVSVKSKEWIQAKKEVTARKTGGVVKAVTKYTGRKRKPKF